MAHSNAPHLLILFIFHSLIFIVLLFSFAQGALGVAHLIENGWNGSIKWKSVTVAMKMEHQVENRCKLKDCNENYWNYKEENENKPNLMTVRV